ncbi:MAG: hypothetical protein Q9169_007868, partial [Polycauliona sp. 2 TL-2023]
MADTRLNYLFNHIFLPAQVPQRSDNANGHGDQALVNALLESIDTFRGANDHAYYQQWSTVQRSLRTFALLHSRNKSLSRTSLESAFQDAATGETIIINVALQNSALLIQKRQSEYVIETFETSPQSADVLAASGALEWDFPSRAVAIPSHTFEDHSFRTELASFLEKASVEPVKQYTATTLKAGSNAYESRDTTFPAIIGQLLITILEVPGRKYTPTLTRKRVRDEVCWSEGAENPWRRRPTWLVLRVSIQRILCSLIGPHGLLHYKFFMCSLLSSLCHKFSTQDTFPADRLVFARTKLARRVAKLEAQGTASNPEASTVIHSLFVYNEKTYMASLLALEKLLDDRGTRMRASHTKTMFRLPKRAPLESTVLSLHHSRDTINQILTEDYYGGPRAQVVLPKSQSRVARYLAWVISQSDDQLSADDLFCLADLETNLAKDLRDLSQANRGPNSDRAIETLRQKMGIYQSRASKAYKEDVEQLSLMIVILMEVWKAIDVLALQNYPLLADYDPGFPSDLFSPLKIAKLSDMRRVDRIEQHLERRRNEAIYPVSNVLGDPTKSCFAVRFYDECEEMQDLSSNIRLANATKKRDKEQELSECSSRYEALLKEASIATSLFTDDQYDPLRRQHDDRHCRKCFLGREASRMRIGIHEDLLPEDDIQAKAVVFELLLPSGFGAWRDSVWQILSLARGSSIVDQNVKLMLREYEGLKQFKNSTQSSVTLASRTKSFYQTHYRPVPLPVQLDQVCLPHALRYATYDQEQKLWIRRLLGSPSFATTCAAALPLKSAWTFAKRYLDPAFDGVYPFANEIVAGQTLCPNKLTVAEYNSFQELRKSQWIKLLRELSSSNISFGAVETTLLVTELALGLGPSEQGHLLRATHWVFTDKSFCKALHSGIRTRLQAIATNWREGQAVECLLMLVRRLWSLGQTVEAIREAEELMLLVRRITHDWIQLLRREICNAVDVETAQTRSRESLHAALLCRKTFVLEATSTNHDFDHVAFACFLECAFTIKDNMSLSESGNISKMPAATRRLYTSDLKLLHSLEPRIRLSLQHIQSAISTAVNSVWMDADGASVRSYSRWTILPAPHDSWCTARSISGEGLLEQSINFNFLDGTLYIDGQLLGRLPEEFAQQDFFKHFFGNRIFLTRPSYLQSMSYMFVSPVEGHEVHFGFRDGYRFMRVRPQSPVFTVLEYLPASIFLDRNGKDAPDLPLPLIDQCVHWFDLQNHIVEVRPFSTMWRSKDSDWKIILRISKGVRRNKSELVDPRSLIFSRVARLIEPFEHRSKMIVFQPLNSKSNLTVNLPGLELSFRVSFDGLLESRQLRA